MTIVPQKFQINSWLSGATEQVFPSIDGDIETDWLVIGTGYTGVSVAKQLAVSRPGDQIVLVDAGKVGQGSGSRSSGFVVSAGQFNYSKSRDNQVLYRLGCAGLNLLRQQVESYGIDCGWNEAGRILGARGGPGKRSLLFIESVMNQIASPCSQISGQEIKEETGMEGYVGGLRQEESVLVNPALLLRGLVTSLPENVERYQDSEVLRISADGLPEAHLSNGKIRAKSVFVTNNAFAMRLGFGKNRVFPMRTFVSVAAPEDDLPLSGNWGLTSPERVGSSLRAVDGKLMIRNTAYHGFDWKSRSRGQSELESVSNFQLDAIQRRFPERRFRIENTWSGVIGVTANAGQLFGKVGENVFVSVGYNGHGIAQATTSGKLLVDLAFGRDSNLLSDMMKLRPPKWIPTGLILKYGVSTYVDYLCWRYRDEI